VALRSGRTVRRPKMTRKRRLGAGLSSLSHNGEDEDLNLNFSCQAKGNEDW
jgi:hypothetical protein